MDPVKKILGTETKYSTLHYRRVHEDGAVGECEMCGKRRKLYDDACLECRDNSQ